MAVKANPGEMALTRMLHILRLGTAARGWMITSGILAIELV